MYASIALLEKTASLRALLLLNERQRYITELQRTSINPDGIASLESVKRLRRNLSELGLIVEEIEDGPRPKTFLVITEKGRRVAEKIAQILEILEE